MTFPALPVRGAFALRPGADIWHKPALSVVITLAVPEVALLLAGRLDLAFYIAAGGLCALYAHGLPYAARARTLLRVILGMLAGTGAALTTAALTDSTAVRVVVAALLACAHKTVCDATRIGPPANVIFTFVAASAAFLPQRLADVPAHLGLGLLGGALAWLVCMAPALVRPYGPERIAVARALEATARLLRGNASRHDAASAVNAAWHTLRLARRGDHLTGLRRLLVRAESVAASAAASAASPDGADRDTARQADRLTSWARELRKDRTLPDPGFVPAEEAAEPAGVDADRAPAGRRFTVLRAFAPGSPLLPVAARVALGGTLAGWASMALGVDRPYWAVVSAAAVFQANTTLSWHRALQRALGSLLGVLLFTALLPLTGTGRVALVAVALACQFGAEATIARNYWLGTVFVTPMAMIMVQFAGSQPAGRLVADRWLDTCVGVAAGLLACCLVPNRRAADRVGAALDHLDAAIGSGARDRLAPALVELREAADTAAGEWWSGTLPEERIATAERRGHRALATLTARTI